MIKQIANNWVDTYPEYTTLSDKINHFLYNLEKRHKNELLIGKGYFYMCIQKEKQLIFHHHSEKN
jgi:hypothetical protein